MSPSAATAVNWPVRYARQCVGVGGGPLRQHVYRRAQRRQRSHYRLWVHYFGRCARRLLDQYSAGSAFREPPQHDRCKAWQHDVIAFNRLLRTCFSVDLAGSNAQNSPVRSGGLVAISSSGARGLAAVWALRQLRLAIFERLIAGRLTVRSAATLAGLTEKSFSTYPWLRSSVG